MKLILNYLLLFFLLLSFNASCEIYYITNGAKTGVGTFDYIYDEIITTNDLSPVIYIDKDLKGDVNFDRTYTFEGLNSFSFDGHPEALLKNGFGSVLTDNIAMSFNNIDVISLNGLNDGYGWLNFSNINTLSIGDCAMNMICNIDSFSVLNIYGGSSGGINAKKGYEATIYNHSVHAGAYFGIFNDVEIATINNSRIGIQDNRLAHSLTSYGLKFVNCKKSGIIRLENNEIVSVFEQGIGDSTGYGIQIKNCNTDIIIRDNYFGIDSSETVNGTIWNEMIYIENSTGRATFDISGNTFANSFKNAIRFEYVEGEAKIKNNIFGLENRTFFDDAISVENTDSVLIQSNYFQNIYYKSVNFTGSSHNIVENNFLGIKLREDSLSYHTDYNSGTNAFYLDENSNHNILRGNYSRGNSSYAYYNLGQNNDILQNYTTCNDSGSFYFSQTNESIQNDLKYSPLILNTSGGEPQSLTLEASIPDGFKATIYKNGACNDNSLSDLRETFIDEIEFSNGSFMYSFSLNKTLDIDSSGYFVIISDKEGNVVGISKTSVEDISTNKIDLPNKMVRIYPNPASDIINIRTASNKFKCTIYNSIGQPVHSCENSTTALNIKGLPKGMYYMKIISDSFQYTTQLIKK